MTELSEKLNSITHAWLPSANALGFMTPGTQSAANFMFSEVGEVLSELENLEGTWARRQDVSEDKQVRNQKLIKELCDVIMMACITAGPGSAWYQIHIDDKTTYNSLALFAGCSVKHTRFTMIYAQDTAQIAVHILGTMVPDVEAVYTQALADRLDMLQTKKNKKEASKRYTNFLDRAHITIQRYNEVVTKQNNKIQLTEDEIVILHLWEELSKRHQEYVDMANRKTVIVPDGNAIDVIELFGQAVDKLNAIELSLRRAGFNGEFPGDLDMWLAN